MGVIVLGLSALFGLHYKRLLPQCFYRIFSARWKPVATDMDVDEEASEKPIIKNGNGLNVSELAPMGEEAKINGDCTVVTYVGEKELVEAAADEEKEEKKDVEKKVDEEEEKKEEVKEEKEAEDAKETDPLKEESESK